MAQHKKTEKEQAQQFALTLPVILGALSALLYWGVGPFHVKPRLATALLIAAPAVCAVAVILPPVWLRFFRLWMKLAEGLAFVMTRVILSVFFFLILAPIGLAMRLFGRRPLDTAWKDGKSTYWIDKEPGEYTVERYQKQF